MAMQIHKEGSKPILVSLLAITIIVFICWLFIPIAIINIFVTIAFSLLFCLIIWFFRIPSRTCPADTNVIYAPADGKIVVIEKTIEEEYFKDERIQVSIFMSPLNVHVNTYPSTGEVTYKKYHKGKYIVAWHPKSSAENERSTVVYKDNKSREILVRQIAGAVARRICTYAKTGIKVKSGEELGFIKFGSRVDVFLPVNAEILCKIDQKSTAKITAIARLA